MPKSNEGGLADELELSPGQRRYALQAVRRVVEADGIPVGRRSEQLLHVACDALGGEADQAAASDRVALPMGLRRAFVDALVVAACIEGDVTRARQTAVEQAARELGVRSHWVGLLESLRCRRVFAVKRALMTRSPDARRLFARLWDEEGGLSGCSARCSSSSACIVTRRSPHAIARWRTSRQARWGGPSASTSCRGSSPSRAKGEACPRG